MAQQIRVRRGTAAEWTSANPTLADGELGVEKDRNRFKLGDGVNAWASLPYFSNNNDNNGAYAPTRTGFWIPASAFLTVLGAPSTVATQSSSCWTFDQASSEAVATSMIPDHDLRGWQAYNVDVVWTVATAISGDVVWRWDPMETATSGGTLTVGPGGSLVTVTAPAQNVLTTTRVASAIAITTSSKHHAMRLTRIATNAADTLTGDAYMVGVLLGKA